MVTVVAPVTLAIELEKSQVILAWPDSAPGYRLEASTNLVAPVLWQSITNPVLHIDGRFRVLLEPSTSQRFFRLRAP